MKLEIVDSEREIANLKMCEFGSRRFGNGNRGIVSLEWPFSATVIIRVQVRTPIYNMDLQCWMRERYNNTGREDSERERKQARETQAAEVSIMVAVSVA